MQDERDARDLTEVGDVLDVQTGLGLLLVADAVGDRAVDRADSHAQPVAAGLGSEAPGLVQVGEALLGAEDLFIVHVGAGALVAHDGAELGLAGDAVGMGKFRDLLRGGNILFERQAAAVDHDGLVAGLHRTLEDGHEVHALVILVDDGHMVQMQQGVLRVIIFEIFFRDGLKAPGLELFPLQTRDLQHGDGLLVDDGLRDGLGHRQIGDVERRDDGMVLPCQFDCFLCFHCVVSFAWMLSAASAQTTAPRFPQASHGRCRSLFRRGPGT